jgi:DNA replication and repair protein RecF
MQIVRLQVQDVRNLKQVALEQLRAINIFFGANGSGKTSLLEAVNLLLVGRSFRHAQLKPILRDGSSQCVAFAELAEGENRLALGMQRSHTDKPIIKCNGERLKSAAELVRIVPVQLLNTEAFALLTGGPSGRREFMDWGLFHVEQEFYAAWQHARRALHQRNSLIRHDKIDRSQLELWSREYARYGEVLDVFRRDYIATLAPRFRQILSELNPTLTERITVVYSRGWARDTSLEALLNDNVDSDLRQGFTRVGPHRADLKLQVGAHSAADTLSRGQIKLVVASLRIAQAELLHERTGRRCVFLIDDLPAELDMQHRRHLCAALERLAAQVLVTCIDKSELKDCWQAADQVAMFHVEHGAISPC